MKMLLAMTAALAVAGPACAAEMKITPLIDARTRYEHVEQAGIARDADALTLRLRGGVQAAQGAWSALIEGQGTLALVGSYYDGLNGIQTRPLVADPENYALHRAQLQYRTKAFGLTAGRQRIGLDDERFVGGVAFRDNAQTFDAVRAEIMAIPKLKLDLSYVWSVRTIWGVDGRGTRQQAVGGDTVLANLSYATPIGALTGFGYLIDQDEAAVQAFRFSSRTFGLRLAGAQPLGKGVRLSYQLSYARQTDWHRNPSDYAADYYLADATLAVSGWTVNAGYEVLGADRGVALAAFQTPLGTNFKFQGWTDKFLATPANGVRDVYLGGGHARPKLFGADAVSFVATWHRFTSDRLGLHYGDEVNLLTSVKIRRTTLSARFAHYEADAFASDTDKLWLQIDWTY